MLASISEAIAANREKIKRILMIAALLLFAYFTVDNLMSNLSSMQLRFSEEQIPAALAIFFAILRALLNAAVTTLQYAALVWLAAQCVRQWEKPPLRLSGGARGWFWFCGIAGLVVFLGGLIAYMVLLPKSFDQLNFRSIVSVIATPAPPILACALASILLAKQKRLGFIALLGVTLFFAASQVRSLIGTMLNPIYYVIYDSFSDILLIAASAILLPIFACVPASITWLMIHRAWKDEAPVGLPPPVYYYPPPYAAPQYYPPPTQAPPPSDRSEGDAS